VQVSRDGTKKYLFAARHGRFVESAWIPDEEGRGTLCVSSQVGCKMNCLFCSTGKQGFQGQLTAGEIVNQIRSLPERAQIQNIVFMGMGEPLHNVEQVTRALANISHPWGAGLSPRRITVSTSGVVTGIDLLAKTRPLPNLAISLNATTDDIRSQLMPVNRRWNLEALLAAARRFPLGHHRRITFEYVLFAGVNDSDMDAARIPRLLANIPSKVNLIPWNPVPGLPFQRPSEQRILAFQNLVRRADLPVYIRTPRGDDTAAACGQLAARSRDASADLFDIKATRHVS
jgi:23S rRNA (adenine2503-C2)-methyltransferase